VVCLCLKTDRICNIAGVWGRCYCWGREEVCVGNKKFDCFIKKTKYRDVLKKSSKEISFKLTDLLL